MATPTNLPTPAVAGQVLTAAYVNQLAGAFRVLQVVQATTNVEATNATATYADTGLSATITPQATTNKILVLVAQQGCSKSNGNANNALGLQLVRGVTAIQQMSQFVGYNGAVAAEYLNVGSQTTIYLDSPNTISATTYKTQFRNVGVSLANVKVQDNIGITQPSSSIILMEISA
jgi:hypothetical protein